jgi:hypothetical protein
VVIHVSRREWIQLLAGMAAGVLGVTLLAATAEAVLGLVSLALASVLLLATGLALWHRTQGDA